MVMTMNYKEKYEMALEGIQEILSSGEDSIKMSRLQIRLQGIFPELKESEDEKIRKELIDYINRLTVTPNNITKYNTWIAWLEKQGEQKPIIDGILTATNYDKMFQNCNVHKFHEGDWIVFNGLVLFIKEVVQGYYRTISVGGIPNSYDWDIDNVARLWTIADAKDGDVLVYNNGTVEIILLFKKWMDGVGKGAYSYANTFDNKILFNDWSDCGYATHPATKEQHELLFQKMREEGYVWDAEKKELREIEYNENDRIRNWLIGYFRQYKEDGIEKYANGLKVESIIAWLEKQGQKPKWTEEDSLMIDNIIDYMRPMPIFFESTKGKSGKEYTKEFIKNAIKWLKLLKQRMEE